jgi:hypothetical protein
VAGMAVGVVVHLFGAEAGVGDGTGARPVEAGMAVGLTAGMVLYLAVLGEVERQEEASAATDAAKKLQIQDVG